MNIVKPYYLHRPKLLFQRIVRSMYRPLPRETELPWGVSILVNPREAIGYQIWRKGIYEIDTVEAVCRLLNAGGIAVDVGANIGYVTSLMMIRAGSNGRIYSFEPNPKVFAELRYNVLRVGEQNASVARVQVAEVALGAEVGDGTLELDDVVSGTPFAENEGVSRINEYNEVGNGIHVKINTLDNLVSIVEVDLLKIDVEGYELQVLRGASQMIAERRIRHIIFEDHQGFGSDVSSFLCGHGYTVFRLSWTLRGPVLLRENEGNRAVKYAPPNYLATLSPDRTEAAFHAPGWLVLRD